MSLNEGNYRVSFEPVDAKFPVPELLERTKHVPNQRLFRVPPCSLNKTECTFASRKKAKIENALAFNSTIQMGESYFIQRNVDNKMRVMKKTLPCKRLNMPGDN